MKDMVIMKVTSVKVRHLVDDPAQKVKAIVSITIDGEFAIHDIKLIQGDGRLFAAMPNRRSEDGRFQDIAHPISSAARGELESAILHAYEVAKQHLEVTS